MAVRTGAGLVVAKPVSHVLAALPAHSFVGLRQPDSFAAAIEGLDKQRAVNRLNRCAARGVLFGVRCEAASGDEKSALGIGSVDGVMQARQVALSALTARPYS